MTSNVTSGPSAADDRNVWARHIKNGDDRTHVPPLSKKLFIIRVVQLVLAVLFLVLAAFAAFTLNMGNYMYCHGGFCTIPWDCKCVDRFTGLSFFVFSWTVVYFVWLGVTILIYPVLYHWIAHIVVEGLTNVFWLATWASLASYASALNVANAGYYFVLAGRQLGIGSDAPPPPPHGAGGPDGGRGPGSAGAGSVGGGPGGPGPTGSSAAAAARSSIQAARISIAVDAGLGAVIWVLFIITLIATTERQRREKART
ncbi:uncharacterized protein PG998_005359 [Apiospora kogelbergensis]|uniref:MARVEL domain-containing protein n=1 Tax=Apiospora kogelbergensis TaxID=1337665 RepID=A0AAW0QB72_9PEZI